MDHAAVRALFELAVSASLAERDRVLQDPRIPDDVRQEVQALLRADRGAETLLRETVASDEATLGIGERFGPFETVEQIGRGGMGTVFRAERVDGELAQTVAIKVVERAWLDPRGVERFRQERQILAGLVHPNIAQLVDGGTRADGVAYLAMEYVAGLPIDVYCDRHGLSIGQRLRLFLPLCDAVDAAHQKLIIHRDLKPSNVLVTDAGEPKLLDFGIARVLGASASAQTRTLVMTPAFSSPEQVTGEDATLATDVYGLGAVLYLLLTGRAPHDTTGLAIEEVRRAVCDTAVVPPRFLRPELKGDLENILLKALHPEPGRRYRSAPDLAEDIGRYLDQRPVRATPDGWAYRATRFVQRHTWATTAAALAALAVIAGTSASLYEARRAQRRFDEVRELATRFVFDFEGAIRDTPGTLTARRMVASTARRYLAELSADADRDPDLRRELAQSYYRLGGVEFAAGESPAAIDHLQQAIALLRELRDDCCGTSTQRKQYFDAMNDLALDQRYSRRATDALMSTDTALGEARSWSRQAPDDALASQAIASTLSLRGEILPLVGRLPDARAEMEESVQRFDGLLAEAPDDAGLRYNTAWARHRLAYVLGTLGETAAALDAERKASTVVDPLIDARPGSLKWRVFGALVKDYLASFQQELGKQDPSLRTEALATARDAYLLARRNEEESPDDERIAMNAAVIAQNYGEMLVANAEPSNALPILRESTASYDALAKADPSQTVSLRNQIDARRAVAECLIKLGLWRDAAAALVEGEDLARTMLQKWPDDLTAQSVQVKLIADRVSVERMLGNLVTARGLCRRGLQVVAGLSTKNEGARAVVATSTASQWVLAGDILRDEARRLGLAPAAAPR